MPRDINKEIEKELDDKEYTPIEASFVYDQVKAASDMSGGDVRTIATIVREVIVKNVRDYERKRTLEEVRKLLDKNLTGVTREDILDGVGNVYGTVDLWLFKLKV